MLIDGGIKLKRIVYLQSLLLWVALDFKVWIFNIILRCILQKVLLFEKEMNNHELYNDLFRKNPSPNAAIYWIC